MKTEISAERFEDIEDKIIIMPMYEESLHLAISSPKTKIERLIKEVVSDSGFKAELKQSVFLNTSGEIKTRRLLLIGLGKSNEIDLERIRKSYGNVVKKVKAEKLSGFTTILPQISNRIKYEDVLYAVVEGIELGNYVFNKYKTYKKENIEIEKYRILSNSGEIENYKKIISKAKNLCDNVMFVRDLVNESGSSLTPLKIAEYAENIAKEHKIKCTVIDEKQMETLGLNLILCVSRASINPPRLIILEYSGDTSSKENIMIVGKGITFDSGGLDLKTSSGMETMKMDMAGAGAVLGIMKSISQQGLKKNVVGVIPTSENLIGPNSYKPGDVIISYSKQSVEILNTDAEGRLVLGDAISYGIEKYKPKYLIDMATLTGAVLIIFGEFVAGLVSNNELISKALYDAGQETFERVWQLPLYEEYKEMIKSDIADIKNIGHKSGYAGTITGAAFIEKFVGDTPWAHIDIAGTAWSESEHEYLFKGGTGYGVRLITKVLEKL